jgi:hypothetical protein
LLDMQALHPITEDMKILTTIRLPNLEGENEV